MPYANSIYNVYHIMPQLLFYLYMYVYNFISCSTLNSTLSGPATTLTCTVYKPSHGMDCGAGVAGILKNNY